MTTLHVREDQLRAAVAQFPSVAGLKADAKFPHKLTIEVRERAPVAAIESGAGRVAAAGDGRVLRGLKASDLPTLHVRTPPPGDRVTDRKTLGALGVAGVAPAELRSRIERLWSGPRGLTLQMRNGPDLVFGSGSDADRKWVGGRQSARRPELRRAPPTSTSECPEGWLQAGSGRSSPMPSRRPRPDPQAPVESSPTLNP